jgi:hypothetical protein
MLSLRSRYLLGRVSPMNAHIHTFADYSDQQPWLSMMMMSPLRATWALDNPIGKL